MWDGMYIGVAIFGKYLPRSSKNTALCHCVGTRLNLMRHWEHVAHITQTPPQLCHKHLYSESHIGAFCPIS